MNMAQEVKVELQPKLRFPEFKDAAGWSKTKLKDVLTEHKLKSDGKCAVHSVSVRKGVINQKEHLGRSFSAADTSNYNLAKPYDVIYTKSPTGEFPYGVIKYNHNKYNAIVSPLYGVFSPKNKYLGYIFDAYFESPIRANNYLTPITQKGAKNTIQITNVTFLSNGIYLPHDEVEQQKIADCLSSIDKWVTIESDKLSLLKAHRAGMMQRLFPAEGEPLPKLRFPEFNIDESWKKQTIANLLKKALNPVTVDLDKLYQQIGIRSHGKGIFHKEFVSGKELGNKRVFWIEENAFILNIVFAWEQAVANTSSSEKGMIASHRFPMYVAKTNKSDVNYIKYFFLTGKGKHLLGLASPGGAGRNKTLGQKEFDKLELLLPEKVEEQTRIAECLSSLDALINAQTQKIETLKTHKQGLMQQLFPSSNEAKG